jgi:RNA polymerase sigma factor (TIGR02999 family)
MTGQEGGGNEATQELFSLMYHDLRRLAHARLQRNEPITLLDTTSLVHETFLRVLQSGRIEVSERPRFLAYAAQVMRSVIVDFVRQRHAERRGGDALRVPLDSAAESVPSAEDEVLRVSEALDELAKVDELKRWSRCATSEASRKKTSRSPWASTNAPSAGAGKKRGSCVLSPYSSGRGTPPARSKRSQEIQNRLFVGGRESVELLDHGVGLGGRIAVAAIVEARKTAVRAR